MSDPRKTGGITVEVLDGSGTIESTPTMDNVEIDNTTTREGAIIVGSNMKEIPPGSQGYVLPTTPTQSVTVDIVLYDYIHPEPDPTRPQGPLMLPRVERRVVTRTKLGGDRGDLSPKYYKLTEGGLSLTTTGRPAHRLPLRSLQLIDDGSLIWRPAKVFQYFTWDERPFTTEVRGKQFQIIAWGSPDWSLVDSIQVKSAFAGVVQDVRLQVASPDHRQFQYIVDGTLNWVVVKYFEFLSWVRDEATGQFHKGRTKVEILS